METIWNRILSNFKFRVEIIIIIKIDAWYGFWLCPKIIFRKCSCPRFSLLLMCYGPMSGAKMMKMVIGFAFGPKYLISKWFINSMNWAAKKKCIVGVWPSLFHDVYIVVVVFAAVAAVIKFFLLFFCWLIIVCEFFSFRTRWFIENEVSIDDAICISSKNVSHAINVPFEHKFPILQSSMTLFHLIFHRAQPLIAWFHKSDRKSAILKEDALASCASSFVALQFQWAFIHWKHVKRKKKNKTKPFWAQK